MQIRCQLEYHLSQRADCSCHLQAHSGHLLVAAEFGNKCEIDDVT